jgi:RNA polymerase sigma factor (sigma-70 family)
VTEDTRPPRLRRTAQVIENRGLPLDFRAFHQMQRPAYVRWAELYLNSRADAEEAVDEAMRQLLTLWRQVLLHPEPAAYAWKVLKNRTIDYARSRNRRPAPMDTAAFETHGVRTAVDPIGELEDSLSLYDAINRLPERQRDVIVLRHSLGYSNKETADILGISQAGVRSTARHARRRLKQVLNLSEEDLSEDEDEGSSDGIEV